MFKGDNYMLLYHVLAFVLANAVSVNFAMVQKHFLRVKTSMPDYDEYEDPFQDNHAFQARITVELLKQLYVVTVAISSAIIVSNFYNENRRALVKWNAIMLVIITLLYGLFFFLHCEFTEKNSIFIYDDSIMSKYGQKTHLDYYCNQGCNCESHIRFSPVCTNDGRTHFSPCHAGCTSFNTINDETVKYLINHTSV